DGGVIVPGEIPIDVVGDAWNGVGLRGGPDPDRPVADLSAFDLNGDGLLNRGREIERAGPLLHRLLGQDAEMVL
ncbi:MAG TPA: hypothetical protein VLJ78_05260, partial [Microvirga sp.]|nr:hypothetical protein [Microvirga sp.]